MHILYGPWFQVDIIDFDDYNSGPYTKDEEHSRRGGKMLANDKDQLVILKLYSHYS